MNDRLDQVLALFQERLGTAAGLQVDEPFASDSPAGVSAPLRALTVLLDGQPFALLGLTLPALAVKNPGFAAYLARRARARRLAYMVLCNQRETQLVRTPKRDDEALESLKQYPALLSIAPAMTGALEAMERIALSELADSLAGDLVTLKRDGRLGMLTPDSEFFVRRLTQAVDVLKPAVKQALQTKLGMDPPFAQELSAWAVAQAIPADLRSPDFAEAVVRQAIYRLLGKIIFYQSLRRAAPHLPEMSLAGLDTGQVMPRLAHCFDQAHQIDYHAVFRQDVVDRLPFPAAASAELHDLVEDLNTRDFAHLPQDVVGAVFERLIPPEDRHALGQYFTPEALVDLIVAFCVRAPEDCVLDPTCGTGTFLIRAYDRLRTRLGVHEHNRLLGQLWGVDIAPFPAELATINLFRQNVGDASNFPRIVNDDFFQIVPGGAYRFPPLKAGAASQAMLDDPIPSFEAIVGNLPYISADRIEHSLQGYRSKLNRRLAEEWLASYPAGFGFPHKADEKQHRLARENGMILAPFLDKAEPIISTFADLYVSLFWHAAAFLKPGGRLGLVTSNAWLDVGYGYALQRFILDHFKIVAILESRCEPWFEQAAVNTVVTIVERCDQATERAAQPARFVQIKRKLAELVAWDMRLDGLARWLGLDGLVQRIETRVEASDDPGQPQTDEDDDFRIRLVRQGALRAQVEAGGQTVKWGPLLRAPQVYFDLLATAGNRLTLLRDIAPPARGSLTGINEFYHLDESRIAEWGIEEEFLLPLLKSPGESDHIIIDESELQLKVFICRLTKDELRQQGKVNALKYIEWGEKQTFTSGAQAGLTWPHGAEVRNRKPGWYALPEYRSQPGQLFISMAYGDRHLNKYSRRPLIADNRLYFLSPVEGVPYDLVAAVMNSSVTALIIELTGRVTLGDGALELKVEDASDYLRVPDVRKFSPAARAAIEAAFDPLLARPIGAVFDEVQRPDRQALDRAVLQAMGLDPDQWLPRLYDGLCALVRERSQLGQMRGQSRRSRPQKAANRVAEQVLQDILPNGLPRFPDDFLLPAVRAGSFTEIPLPAGRLRHKGAWMGKEELASDDGQTMVVANKVHVRYILFAQASGQQTARLPEKPVEVSRAVNTYIQYLRELRGRLHQAYFTRTLDQAAAGRFVADVWRKLGLPEIE